MFALLIDKETRVVKYATDMENGGIYLHKNNAVIVTGDDIEKAIDYNSTNAVVEEAEALPEGYIGDRFIFDNGEFTPIPQE